MTDLHQEPFVPKQLLTSAAVQKEQAPCFPVVGFDALLAGSARRFGTRIALCDGGLTLTFTELDDLARRFAGALRDDGIGPGDRVAIAMPNSLWYSVAYYGILCAGATACAVNHLLPPTALAEHFATFGATALVTHPACITVGEARTPTIRTTIVVEPTATSAVGDAGPGPDGRPMAEMLRHAPWTGEPCDPDAIAHLQMTGGTTGRSKGVQILHRNIVANTIQCCTWRHPGRVVQDPDGPVYLEQVADGVERLGEGVMLQLAPFYHGAGLVGLSASLVAGTTTVFHGRFAPERYLASVEEYGVTRIGGTPAMFHGLLAAPNRGRHELSSVTSLFSGTAPISTTALTELGKLFPRARITQGYGLSEATCYTAMQSTRLDSGDSLGGVGRPLPGTVVEIRDPEGEPLPVGEIGEVFVHGPQVAGGYHDAPELTRQQFRDGWLRTGDLGHLDGRGELFLTGRAKDMLIYKGYNVYPQALEELLTQHPAVARCAVVGRPVDEVGQIPVAFVVLTPSACAAESEDLAAELADFVAARVAPYQKVREVRFVGELPLTDIGKVAKPLLVDMLTA